MDLQNRSVIEVCGLSHRYFAGTPLEVASLRGVNLVVSRDESVGIIGPAGSGKSTLLSHLNGLIRPQEGDVRVFGESLSDRETDLQEIRRKVGLLFQSPEDQLFEQYAGDDVAFGPRNFIQDRDEIRSRVRNAMEMVGLSFDFKDRLTAELSLGEKRRLALAGVFALEPAVLVLDEPTASLDPGGRRDLLQVLRAWQGIQGRALVVVSHNLEDIVELADRTYVLVEGKVVCHGKTVELFSSGELLSEHGLLLPDFLEIIRLLKARGFPLTANGFSIEAVANEIAEVFHGS